MNGYLSDADVGLAPPAPAPRMGGLSQIIAPQAADRISPQAANAAPVGTLSDADVGLAPLTAQPATPAPLPVGDLTMAPGAISEVGNIPPSTAPMGNLSDKDVGLPTPGAGTLFMQGLQRGVGESASNINDAVTGRAFSEQFDPQAPQGDPLSQHLGQPFLDGGYKDPAWYAANLSHGLGASAPALATAGVGALAGGAVGGAAGGPVGAGVGGVVGGGLGMALGNALPAVRQAYVSARQQGMNEDDAAQYAMTTAKVSAATGFAMGAMGGAGKLFEATFIPGASMLGRVGAPMVQAPRAVQLATSPMGQALVTQPVIGAAGQVAQAAATDTPLTGEDLAKGAASNVLSGAVLSAMTHGGNTRFNVPKIEVPNSRAPGLPGPDPGAAPGAGPVPTPAPPPVPPAPAPPGVPPVTPKPVVPVTPAGQNGAPPPTGLPPNDPNPLAPRPPGNPVSPVPQGVRGGDSGAVPPGGTQPGVGGSVGPIPPSPGGIAPAPPGTPGAVPPTPAPGGLDGSTPPAPPGQLPGAGGNAPPVPGGGGQPGSDVGNNPPGSPAPGPPNIAAGPLRTETVSTHTGRKVDTEFRVIGLDDSQPATGQLQPRDRSNRAASDAQIADIVAKFDPSRLGSSAEADRGSPIIGPDGIRETGNGRLAAIQRIYEAAEAGDPAAQAKVAAYRAMIESHGYTIPQGVARPTLVRLRTTPLDDANRQAFVDEANVSATARMSPVEQARTDARGLTPERLSWLQHDATGGIGAASNTAFVQSWVKSLPQSEHGSVQDSSGRLSQAGIQRLHAAVLARAYDDPAALNRMIESVDPDTKAIGGALADASMGLAKIKAGIESGTIPPELDISRDLLRAADLVNQARAKGQAPADILAQDDVFDPMSNVTREAVRAFYNDGMTRLSSRVRINNILGGYAKEALAQTASLVPGAKLDPATYLEKARLAAVKDKPPTDPQGSMFGGSKPPEQDAALVPPAPPTPPTPAPPEPAPAPPPAAPAAPAVDPAKAAQLAKLQATLAKHEASGNTKAAGLIRGQIAKLQKNMTTPPEPKTPKPPAPKPPAPAPAADPLDSTAQHPSRKTSINPPPAGMTDEMWSIPSHSPRTALDTANDWAAASGRRSGHEHIATVDVATGEIVAAGTDGKVGQVRIPTVPAGVDGTVITHNHPRNTGMSPPDVGLLAWRDIAHMIAQGSPKGGETAHTYHATLTPKGIAARENANVGDFNRSLQGYSNRRADMLIDQMRKMPGGIPPDADAHLMDMAHRIEAARTGLYRYESSRPIPPSFDTFFDQIATIAGLKGQALADARAVSKPADQLEKIRLESRERFRAAKAAGKLPSLPGEEERPPMIDDTEARRMEDSLKGEAAFAAMADPTGTIDVMPWAQGERVTVPLPALPGPGYDPENAGSMPGSPHHTADTSRNRVAVFRELGVADPEGMTSKPASVQAHILGRAVQDKYSLAGITVHRGAEPLETIDQLADAHTNLQGMAAVMGLPNSAIGLDGKLHLWLGPRNAAEVAVGGNNFALGVYRLDNKTIYMPGRSNSFAHEWTHALDDHLAGLLPMTPPTTDLLSKNAEAWSNAPAGTPAHAFAQVMGSLFGTDARTTLEYLRAQSAAARAPTPANARALATARAAYRASEFYQQANRVGGSFGNYLTQPYELLARAHEAYLSDQISRAGGETQFVAKPEAAYLQRANRNMAAQYPNPVDRARIFAAFSALHDNLRLHGVYPRGVPALMPVGSVLGIGPAHWGQFDNVGNNQAHQAALAAQAAVVNQAAQTTGFWARRLANIGIGTGGADPGYLTNWVRTTDGFRAFTFSPRGMMHTILARAPAGAKGPLRSLLDRLTTDPGKGYHISRTFEEDNHQSNKRDYSAYGKILNRAGFSLAKPMTEADGRLLAEAMTQREPIGRLPENIQRAIRDNTINQLPAADQARLRANMMGSMPAHIPQNIRTLAADIRQMLDQKYYEQVQAGLELDYTDGHWPRMMADHRIYAQPDAFEADARRAMAVRNDRETEKDGQELADRFHAMRDRMDPGVWDPIKAAYTAARAAWRASPAGQAGATPEASDFFPDRADRQAIHDFWGAERAKEWRNQIMSGDATTYDTRGPAGNHLKSRVMPPEADAILRDWYVTDANALVPHYLRAANRKLAYVRRFGLNGDVIDKALTAAAAVPGMRPEDITEFRRNVELITGKRMGAGGEGHMGARLMDQIGGLSVITLMPRAVFSAIGEPMAVMARTGSVGATWAGFANIVGDMARTANALRVQEIANYIGAVTHSMFDETQANRAGLDYSDAQGLAPAMTNFFRMSGLTSLTNAQRRAAVVSAHHYLASIGRDIRDNITRNDTTPAQRRALEDARAYLRDLSIPDAAHADFAKWIAQFKAVPGIDALHDNANGMHWSNAVNRFVDQVNQDPKTSEKPMIASHPFGRLVFSLMGFSYSFFANVMERFFHDAARKMTNARGFGEKANVFGHLVMHGTAGAAAIFMGQMLTTPIREYIFNGTKWDEHKKEGDLLSWLASLAFSRSNFGGPMDAVAQAYTSLKYQKSLAELGIGAGLGYITQNIEKIFGHSSPNTNTSSYNRLVGIYNLSVAPLAALGMAAARSTNPLGNAAGSAVGMKLSSQSAADAFATYMVGPKGSREPGPEDGPMPKSSAAQRIWRQAAARRAAVAARDAERDRPKVKPKSEHGSGALASAAISIGDDMAPAAVRAFSALPLVGKIAAGVAAGGYAVKTLADEFSRYPRPPAGRHETK